MSNISNLEINQEVYNHTKDIIIQNGSPLWEHSKGSRVTLYSNGIMCATTTPGDYLILNKGITKQQFTSFLAIFKKTLLTQFKKNDALFELNITYDGVSRDKNFAVWNEMPIGMDFYTVDLNSAYWQMAYKLGYITKPMFTKYVDDNTYKEAKRYCISFLSRQEYMTYHDGREINKIYCNVDCFIQVYDNIRNSLYQSIHEARLKVNDWIDYNIDAVTVKKEDVHVIANAFDNMQLFYKIKKCIKTGEFEYVNDKGVIRKF